MSPVASGPSKSIGKSASKQKTYAEKVEALRENSKLDHQASLAKQTSSYSAALSKKSPSGSDWQTKGRNHIGTEKTRKNDAKTRMNAPKCDDVKDSDCENQDSVPKTDAEKENSEKKNFENTKPERCKNTQVSLCITLNDKQIGYLFAEKGIRLKDIHEANGTSNQRIFYNKTDSSEIVPFTIFGATMDHCLATKEAIEKLVGISRQKEEDARFQYYSNEVHMNIRAMQYIMQKNLQLGEDERLADNDMQSISSFLNFEKQAGVEHYTYLCKNDKSKKATLDLLIDQFAGKIQMIVYCNVKQAPLIYEHLIKRKEMNNSIEPILLIPATKEDRKEMSPEVLKEKRSSALQQFKDGVAHSKVHINNEQETVAQRILIATDDYARYARTREIPHVNLIVHYSPPRQREWFLFRSETIARGMKNMEHHGLVGCQLSLFSESEEHAMGELKQIIDFKKLPHEEEKEFFQRWYEALTPETKENPRVDYCKVEPVII